MMAIVAEVYRLLIEAQKSKDDSRVSLCRRALDGDPVAICDCVEIIQASRAQSKKS